MLVEGKADYEIGSRQSTRFGKMYVCIYEERRATCSGVHVFLFVSGWHSVLLTIRACVLHPSERKGIRCISNSIGVIGLLSMTGKVFRHYWERQYEW